MKGWVARDKNGRLFLYWGKEKPQKFLGAWFADVSKTFSVRLTNDLFPEVKWSDAEPTKVKLEIVKQ